MISTETMYYQLQRHESRRSTTIRVRQAPVHGHRSRGAAGQGAEGGLQGQRPYSYVPAVDPTYDGPKVARGSDMSKEEREAKAQCACWQRPASAPTIPLKLGAALHHRRYGEARRHRRSGSRCGSRYWARRPTCRTRSSRPGSIPSTPATGTCSTTIIVGDFPGPETLSRLHEAELGSLGYNWKNHDV
ncbi:MAG: hypothetical protein MZV70_45660 [Desulfobacterales bacterium]|nr:hypothetical protein [Desulfobacterales bacterium]